MNKKLLDILVCPFDKITSLELLEFQSASQSQSQVMNGKSSEINESESISNGYTSTKNDSIPTGSNQPLQQSTIVEEGLLLCRSCKRFYPITEEIPIILPDELRDKKKDIEFLKKWKEHIPADLLANLKPWTT